MRRLPITAAVLFVAAGCAMGGTVFGSLSNFDIYNDTGMVAHGFQIDFQGLTAADVLGSFTWSRYGAPVISESGGTVYVRYESAYTTGTGWAASTIVATNPTPTGGHQCVTGPAGNQTQTNGCEHFGISTRGNPVNENYHWLVDGGAGNLTVAGSKVNLPAPVWNIPAAPQPVVQAVVQAPQEIEAGAQFGDALWVKVFTTESPVSVPLDNLVSGDPAVPDSAAETEVEWQLLQHELNGHGNEDISLDNGGKPVSGVSIIRRYEFYKYNPVFYDSEHQATETGIDPNTKLPIALGAFIGSQNVAADLAPDAVPEPTSLLIIGGGLALLGLLRRRR